MMYFKPMRSVQFMVLVALVVMGSLCPLESRAHDPTNQGSATAAFLKLDPAAKSAGVGSAYLGNGGELSAYFNPAGLHEVEETKTVLTENEIFAGITYRYLSLTSRHEATGGGFGFSVTSMDFGTQDRTRVDSINRDNPVTGLGSFSAGDMAFTGSYGGNLTKNFSIGTSLKYVQSQIAGYQGGTFSGDLGLQVKTPVSGLRFGVAGRNLFGKIKLNQKSDPLPRVFEFGGNYDYALSPARHELQFGFGIGTARDSDEYYFSGLSYDLYRIATMRVGYNGSQEADDGFTFGFGLRYGGVNLDYAYVPFGNLGRQQRFTLGIDFGGAVYSDSSGDNETAETPSDYKPSLEAGLYKAARFYENDKLEKAYDILRRLNEGNPENVDILLRLGEVERKLGYKQAARRDFERVLELEPDNPRAQKLLDKLNESAATSTNALLNQGKKHFDQDNFVKARVVLLKAFERSPEDTAVLYWLGRAESQLGLEARARERFLAILEKDPGNDRARDAFMAMK